MTKPRLFVGSSREKMEIARAIQEALDYDAEMIPWDQGAFGVSEYPLESLEHQSEQADFAIFILAPDDLTTMRGEQLQTVRDNVIFELGLFLGRLGRKRTFIVTPRDVQMHLPSDLKGLTPVDYEPSRADENVLAALGPAAAKIRTAMKEQGLRERATNTGTVQTVDAVVSEEPNTEGGAASAPETDWVLEDYERAFMVASFRERTDEASIVDKAFRESSLCTSEETIDLWEAWTAYVQMLDGKPGAVSILKRIAEKNHHVFRVWQWLGHALSRFGDKRGASEAYKKALANAQSTSNALHAVEHLVEAGADLDTEDLRSQLLTFPQTSDEGVGDLAGAMRKLADYGNCKKLSLAIDEVRIQNEPDNISLRFSIAFQHSEIENKDLSLLHYETIPARQRHGMAWNNLGATYQSLSMPGRAVEAYEIASKAGETIANGNLANKLIQAGFFDEARVQIDEALKVTEHHESVLSALTEINTAKSQEEKKRLTARVDAERKQLFLRKVGTAAISHNNFDIVGSWDTPDGMIDIVSTGGNSFSGVREFKQKKNSMGAGLLLSPTEETIRVEIKLKKFGNAFEGTFKRAPRDTASISILSLYLIERSILLYPSETGHALYCQWQNAEREEVQWERSVSPQ